MPLLRFGPIVALCIAMLVGCDQKETASAAPPGAPSGPPSTVWPATKDTTGGSFAVTLQPNADPIVRNKHFSLDLTIDAKDEGSNALKVSVDADMPAHRHGMNTQPELAVKGDSHYQVDGMLFHMAGEWVITVEVTCSGKTERVSFPVLVE